MSSPVTVVAKGEREIVITRAFDAPRHLVFEAHTVPQLLRRWFTGPDGWALTTCEIDLRAGGAYRYEWTHQDGRIMGMGGTFREVDPPARLVSSELFDEDWTGGETINTTTFEEAAGRTTLTTTVLYASAQARDGALGSNMEAGIAASYARLDALLAGAPIGEDVAQ
ncbi:SRPBCC family protein [Sphingosinicella sp. LHD-64]|uniref:SRPBCC family protein n=1 Tax=Sphingosinicella sp. LHD-64 TaxID=3072139 RepID=UPI00280F009E|nr:SRPBCC family protein [Sphingosinicella sp. LHD-64]MDQ8756633.1 SRPBCC family protein [Sphingosinicella sp. LHD-64]